MWRFAIPCLLPCGCLTPATQGLGESSVLSSRNMTSSLSPSNPPLMFGCNPIVLETYCYPATGSNDALTAAQSSTLVSAFFHFCFNISPVMRLLFIPTRGPLGVPCAVMFQQKRHKVCHKQENSPVTAHQCQPSRDTYQKCYTLLIIADKQAWLLSC